METISHRLPVLTQEFCQSYSDKLFALRPFWRPRHALVPFYTVGLAAYLDAYYLAPTATDTGVITTSDYLDSDNLQANNQWLAQQFTELYARLCTLLSAHLKAPVQLTDTAAYPGFHIYLAHPVFAHPVAQIHQDRQYRQAYPNTNFAPQELFSFTLGLRIPKGSGLDIWPTDNQPPEFISYTEGDMVIHNGCLTHQAVINSTEVPRITLQGHAVKRQDRFEIYW